MRIAKIIILAMLLALGCSSISLPIVRVENHIIHKEDNSTTLSIFNGTGFFVSRTGVIVTAAHVIEDHHKIFVYHKGRKVAKRAQLLLYDREADFAILRISGVKVKTPLRFCKDLAPGDSLSAWAWRDFGVERTRGQITKQEYAAHWATGIMVGPGFSGGPAYNEARRCVAGVVIASNGDFLDPDTLIISPEASARGMELLRKIAPSSVRGM